MYTSGVRLIHLLQIHDSLPPRSLISIHLIFSLRHAFLLVGEGGAERGLGSEEGIHEVRCAAIFGLLFWSTTAGQEQL